MTDLGISKTRVAVTGCVTAVYPKLLVVDGP